MKEPNMEIVLREIDNLVPKRGAYAVCSLGHLGIILSESPQEIVYKDGNKGLAWTGIHIADYDNAKIGDPWSSRNPKVLFYAEDLKAIMQELNEELKLL